MINETIMETAKASAYTPSLMTLWIVMILTFFLITWAFKGNKNWGNFWGVLFFTTIISGIVMLFIIYSPEWITKTIENIKSTLNV